MDRLTTTACLSLAVALFAGCPAEQQKKPVARAAPGPSAVDRKLDLHREMQQQLRASHEEFLAKSDLYEEQKGAYLAAVSAELTSPKARVKPEAVKAIGAMTTERTQVAADLSASLSLLGEALSTRARAAHAMLSVEAKLWDLEAEGYDGRAAAAACADEEIRILRDTLVSLHVAQKGQQGVLATLVTREFEANATVGEDIHARDVADRQLAEMRTDLDQRYATLLDTARAYDRASDQVHRKLLQGLNKADAKQQVIADRMGALLRERDAATQAIAAARTQLKEAVLKRAELRSREISHDGEIAAILDGAFKDAALRDAALIRVRSQRDGASEARVATQNAELALAALRRKLATLEGDITALGY
ncbi:MAG: hypothetical protein EXR72_03760 [Myxococcales bacterium]|nr:hypothetical protein [Myxococcales bacterium]